MSTERVKESTQALPFLAPADSNTLLRIAQSRLAGSNPDAAWLQEFTNPDLRRVAKKIMGLIPIRKPRRATWHDRMARKFLVTASEIADK